MPIGIFKPHGVLIALLVLLHGCGGGGGGGGGGGSGSTSASSTAPNSTAPAATAVPSAPTAALDIGVKQLRLSWNAVSGASYYRVLEKADASSGFNQIGGDLPSSQLTFNRAIAVHLQHWASARYQVQACNTNGCATSNTLDAAGGVLRAIGYFKASNTASGDTFGWSLALSGDGATLAVGAPGEDSAATTVNGAQNNDSAADSGAVYVFSRSADGTWSQQAYVKAGNSNAGDNFGEAVALSADGNTLIVGAPLEDSAAAGINGNAADNSAANAGAVYVYSRSNGVWSQQAYLKAANTYANAYFGWSVAVSSDGSTVAVGAVGDASNATGINGNGGDHSAADAGAAYVFVRSAGAWSQQAYVKASNTDAGDNFGAAVALNAGGDRLAVGAPFESSGATGVGGAQGNNAAADAGAVYVFSRSGVNWSQQAYVKASNTGAGDNFGNALALDAGGNVLAVGAPYEASAAVAVGGNQSDNSAIYAGAVYVFSRSGGNWSQQAYVKASNTNANDNFGSALALSADGTLLAVGAIGESSAAVGLDGAQSDNSIDGVGAVYLYRASGGAWSQQTYLKPAAATLGGEFGSAIAFSADTTTLAISAAFETGGSSGLGGNPADTSKIDAGALWLY